MKDLTMLLDELKDMSFFNKGDICLIGCSTSEVIGEKLGPSVRWKLQKLF